MKYDPLTRLLHLAVALGIGAQMLTSLVMVHPKPGRLPNQWYEIHETVGMAVFALVLAYWLWVMLRTLMRGEALMLFPWFSRRLRAALFQDAAATARTLAQGRLPAGDSPQPLPSAVQGGGLLLALALGTSGTIMALGMALGMAPEGGMSPVLRAVKEAHEAMAPVMWAYLVAHPLLGLLHQLAGHRSLTRMFGFR